MKVRFSEPGRLRILTKNELKSTCVRLLCLAQRSFCTSTSKAEGGYVDLGWELIMLGFSKGCLLLRTFLLYTHVML